MTTTPDGKGLIMTEDSNTYYFKCDTPQYSDSPVECYWIKNEKGRIKTPRFHHLTFKIPISWVKDCVDQNPQKPALEAGTTSETFSLIIGIIPNFNRQCPKIYNKQ